MKSCGHDDAPAGVEAVCEHLAAADDEWISSYRWYLGRGMETELLCAACAALRQQGGVVIANQVCRSCLELILKQTADVEGVRGSAEVRQKLVPVATEIAVLPTAPFIIGDVAPVAGIPHQWMGLAADGVVVSIDTATQTRCFTVCMCRMTAGTSPS